MSTQTSKPFTTPRTSKIPRPVKSRTDVSKKASTEVKAQHPLELRTNSDIKPLGKRIRHQFEPKCRRPLVNDIQPKSAPQSESDDVHFEPSQQSLHSILSNQGIVPGVNMRESAIQSGKRSSVYYIPNNETSILKSQLEFKQNLKVLQEKIKHLNICTTVKKQDVKMPSTPNQPISIYHKIKPLSKDRTGRKLLHQTLSERKVLKPQNSEGLCRSASKVESASSTGALVFGLKSIQEKENKSAVSPLENSERFPLSSQPTLSTGHIKLEESKVIMKNGANDLAAESVLYFSVPQNQNCAFDSQTYQSFKKPSVAEVSSIFSTQKTSQIANDKTMPNQNVDQMLIPLSLLMTPTPPRSRIGSPFHPSWGTPSTPKYSSVLSTNTSSTWAFQDTVSTPKLSQLSTHSNNAEEKNQLHSAFKTDKSKSDYKADHGQNGKYGVKTNSLSAYTNCQAITTSSHTPRTPNLSSCLKVKSVDDSNLEGKASCAKRLRWADMPST